MNQNKPVTSFSLHNAHGAIPYSMTNDYMFRAVLQSNNKVLRGLVRSLLHLKEEEILSVKITNPIILGESVDMKEFRLDINVVLNNHTLINLEMQVANQLNWNNRSLLYLCRSFDSLHRGEGYEMTLPVIHIGFLDYTLFKECPEFYAIYKLMNVKTHQIYNDNFTLCVVDLSKTDIATEEDKQYHIDYWARLFKAGTWEEIKMLATGNEYMQAAADTIFELNADELIRKQCRDREEYYQDLRNYENVIAQKDAAILERDTAIIQKDVAIVQKDATIAELQQAALEAKRLRALLKEHGITDPQKD